MNRTFRRILFIDDPQILRWGRMSGWFVGVTGVLLVAAAPFVYTLFRRVGAWGRETGIGIVESLLLEVEQGSDAHARVLHLEEYLPRLLGFPSEIAAPFAIMLLGCGFSFLFCGVLYLRLREVIVERDGMHGSSDAK